MTMINKASFQINGAFDDHSVFGTVEVTLADRTQRVRAVIHTYDNSPHLNGITAYGITGRYRTGMKAWPGYIQLRDGWTNEHVSFGFDSRSGKHHKATISFTKEA